MTWVEASRGFWRSACGRFDVVCVMAGGRLLYAAAYDWEAGRRRKFAGAAEARAWCQGRAAQKAA